MEVTIIGAGGHAAEIDEYINYSRLENSSNDIVVKGFIDDNSENYSSYRFSAPYLGSIADFQFSPGDYFIIGIANLEYRKYFVDMFSARGARWASFIHANAYVSESAFIGEGSIIGPHVNIGPNVRVGRFNLINSRCSLGHDTVIGNYNFISPNVCFSGFTKIGDENLFGINSSTVPDVLIGNRNKITAGMVLNYNIGDDSVVFFRYREKVIARPKQ